MNRKILVALAGPLLIAIAVIAVLHEIALFGRMSIQHVDPLPYWLPSHCFAGESLSAGRVPGWNPHVMGGVPFAADPQSGWLYAPAMLLYALLPCAAALNAFVVLQPILAGLGIYAFLRIERLGRPAATVGGLALAVAMASSRVALTLPFSGGLAWTAVMLAAAAGFFRAERPSARVPWAIGTALAWGQVATAHMSHALVIGTGALVFYVLARALGAHPRRLGTAALLVASLPMVNAAILLPRLAYLSRSTFALGYERMRELTAELGGGTVEGLRVGAAVDPRWVLGFVSAPGAYLGITALVLVAVAWAARRHRVLVAAFGGYAALCYLLGLELVARGIRAAFSWVPFAEFYLHEPARVRYGVLLALPVLAAVGAQAWQEHGRPRLLIPGLAVWLVLPAVLGLHPFRLALPVAVAAAAVPLLLAVRRRPAAAVLVPVLLALEVVASGVAGQYLPERLVRTGLQPPIVTVPYVPLMRPQFRTATYLQPGPIAERLRREEPVRFLSLDPSLVGERGYLDAQDPENWGLLFNQQAMLFGLEDAQGYNPVQQVHYWRLVRASGPPPDIKYNAAAFLRPPPAALDLLQVGFVVGPVSRPPLPGATLDVADGRWGLWALPDPAPRASVVGSWRVVDGPEEALEAALSGGSDPGAEVLLEEDPGISTGAGGSASFRWDGPDRATVDVIADGPGVLLIRNVHDPHWRAEVNGAPAEVLRAHGVVQAVPVPGGRHTVRLRYLNPWVGGGALSSALVLGSLLVLGLALRRGERRPASREMQDAPQAHGQSGRHPGQARGQGTPGHRQDGERDQDVHGDGQRRDHAQPGGQAVDPQPPGGEQAGQD